MSKNTKAKQSDDFRITWVNPVRINGRYQVIWEVESDEATPQKAANEAWTLMQRRGSFARYFTVVDRKGRATKVIAKDSPLQKFFDSPPFADDVVGVAP